jgi:Ca2+-binding RTX toxin-like protein
MANIDGTDNSETINLIDGVTNGFDLIFGFGGDDSIFGLGGNDVIEGGAGADSINGGPGDDTATYMASAAGVIVSLVTNKGSGGDAEGDTLNSIEHLLGSAHADTLVGNADDNTLSGQDGNDTLKGGGGADSLFGEGGNDTLMGGAGGDNLNGGLGSDTVSYSDSSEAVYVELATNSAAGGTAAGDFYTSIENVTGSSYNDILSGDGGNNVLRGGAGTDFLYGLGGSDLLEGGNGTDMLHGGDLSDTLNGGNGDDYLNGGTGGDVMNGGDGIDTMFYTGSSAGVVVNLGAGSAQGGDAAGDTYSSVENLLGSAHADTLFGNFADNEFYGAQGDDFLFGSGGNDTFVYRDNEFGNDTILDFTPGSDQIRFENTLFFNLDELNANMMQIGDDVVIQRSPGHTITLENVMLASLGAGDFVFL